MEILKRWIAILAVGAVLVEGGLFFISHAQILVTSGSQQIKIQIGPLELPVPPEGSGVGFISPPPPDASSTPTSSLFATTTEKKQKKELPPEIISRMDFSGDGKVDIRDLSIFLYHFGRVETTDAATFDFDGNGVVDLKDVSIFLYYWES